MRQHFIKWTCDRCGVEEMRPGKSDANCPPGWNHTLSQPAVDLCRDCHAAYASLFHDFLHEVSPHPGHTVVDEELAEMDPETHPNEGAPI